MGNYIREFRRALKRYITIGFVSLVLVFLGGWAVLQWTMVDDGEIRAAPIVVDTGIASGERTQAILYPRMRLLLTLISS